MRILVVEDNEKLGRYIKESLEGDGYAVDVVTDGASGERMALSGHHDCIVLDIMLPEKDGISVCRDLREANILTPIIMATAKSTLDDKIMGLDSGADDYIVKPFALEELRARVRALLRRPAERIHEKLTAKDIVIDTSDRIVTQNGELLALTLKEYAVLEYLIRNKGRVVSRDDLLAHCWDFAYDPFSNITDAYIKQLRKKLHDKDETYIRTVRGAGYAFNA